MLGNKRKNNESPGASFRERLFYDKIELWTAGSENKQLAKSNK